MRTVGPGIVQDRQIIIAVVAVLLNTESQLSDVAHAADALRFFAGGIQGREKHPGQNRNDRNRYQKFDQRKFQMT